MPVLIFCLLAATPVWSIPVTVTPVSLADFDVLLAQTEQCVVVAMASWCGPCKTELPYLVSLYRDFKKNGLVLFGLSLDFAGAQAMQPVVNKYGVDFPVYWAGEAAVGHYGLNPIPMLVFFRNGRIVDRVRGVHDEEELRAILSDFLERKKP
ncbi:MAG: TlpA family protein disulfide reductase [Thermodesulfobacteriota bacterium]